MPTSKSETPHWVALPRYQEATLNTDSSRNPGSGRQFSPLPFSSFRIQISTSNGCHSLNQILCGWPPPHRNSHQIVILMRWASCIWVEDCKKQSVFSSITLLKPHVHSRRWVRWVFLAFANRAAWPQGRPLTEVKRLTPGHQIPTLLKHIPLKLATSELDHSLDSVWTW